MDIRIRDTEACERQPQLVWDTIWIERADGGGGYGDWIMSGPQDQVESRGGLRAEHALHTATLLQLFTDRRADDDDTLPRDDGDRRGWWGDTIRLDDEPAQALGSRLWLLERAVFTPRTFEIARDYVIEALATMAEQGAVARTDVEVSGDQVTGHLYIAVSHYSHDGRRAYEQRFGVLWQQMKNPKQMNFRDRAA